MSTRTTARLFAPTPPPTSSARSTKGDWLRWTPGAPVPDRRSTAGEVSSYGDRSNNGRATANTSMGELREMLHPLLLTIMEAGEPAMLNSTPDLEPARLNWVSELQKRLRDGLADLDDSPTSTYRLHGSPACSNYGLAQRPAARPQAISPVDQGRRRRDLVHHRRRAERDGERGLQRPWSPFLTLVTGQRRERWHPVEQQAYRRRPD